MIKSYAVETAPMSVVSIDNNTNGYIVYCYEDDYCVHIEHCNTVKKADSFGIDFLNCDWNTKCFFLCKTMQSYAVAA
jgi:hypothetical protein